VLIAREGSFPNEQIHEGQRTVVRKVAQVSELTRQTLVQAVASLGSRHAKQQAKALEAAQPEAFKPAHHAIEGAEGSRKKERPQGRAPLSKPCRQHASGEEKVTAMASKRSPFKDPRGGLTAAGRAEFKRKSGARLKAGVKKPISAMTPEEMRRKGSWAVRFYGRSGKLPALRDKHGRPTRFALTAHAWGEPVPKTIAAARRIADKGRRLLDRYRAKKKSKPA
jgi:hypothetical protein